MSAARKLRKMEELLYNMSYAAMDATDAVQELYEIGLELEEVASTLTSAEKEELKELGGTGMYLDLHEEILALARQAVDCENNRLECEDTDFVQGQLDELARDLED